MSTILITGASGFIGRHCLSILKNSSHSIYAVTTRKQNDFIENDNITWIESDLLQKNNIHQLLSTIKPSHLLHLAWITTHGQYLESGDNIKWLNTSKNLIDEFIKYGGKRVIITGTCAEYDWPDGCCNEDHTAINPLSKYSNTKVELYRYVSANSGRWNISFAWGRVFFAYGPHESPGRLVSSVIERITKNKLLDIEYGIHKRDYIYVEDIASILVMLLDSSYYGTVNIGTGKAISIIEIVHSIADLMKVSSDIKDKIKSSMHERIPLVVADVNKLNNDLGFYPHYDIMSGLKATIAWHKNKQQDSL